MRGSSPRMTSYWFYGSRFCEAALREEPRAALRPGHGVLSPRTPSDRFRPQIASPESKNPPMSGRPKFVLASGSPRRLALLNQAGIEPDALRPADVDETPRRGELPRACANRLARVKADAALKSVRLDDELRGSFILAADTVVAVGRRILPKADLVDEASQCLRLLSGRNHRVYTAICLVTPKEAFRQRLIETRVRFKRLSEEDIQAYIGSGEWRGKAGGYAVQGIAGTFVVKIVGSYSNVVGLPLYETMSLLGGEGFPIRFGWLNAS
jgi:septum formation protein